MPSSTDEAIDLQIAPADLAFDIKQADKRSMDVDTCLKMLLHEALTREAKAS